MPFIYHYILLISLGIIELLVLLYNFKKKNSYDFIVVVDVQNNFVRIKIDSIIAYWEEDVFLYITYGEKTIKSFESINKDALDNLFNKILI